MKMSSNKVEVHRSVEASSEISYCIDEGDTWDDGGSHSSLSLHNDEQLVSSSNTDAASLRAERDALARALAAERARAASAARAHDARLAELHGVIAELVRRRAGDIPEEPSERSDECESTTQPAGDLENDADGDRSGTDRSSSSVLSPAELPTPQERPRETELADRLGAVTHSSPRGTDLTPTSSRSRDPHDLLRPPSGEHCESRHPKVASRVRLRRTEDEPGHAGHRGVTACRLALELGVQADLSEALLAAGGDVGALTATLMASRARVERLESDNRVLECALARATHTAQRVTLACAVHESSTVGLCSALRAADRALEVYDVLLALAETGGGGGAGAGERAAAERVAGGVLARLEGERCVPGEPLVSPGPWAGGAGEAAAGEWSAECEGRLREHAARLKAETVRLREHDPPPGLFSYHEEEPPSPPAGGGAPERGGPGGRGSGRDMELAVVMQEAAAVREERATALALLCARSGARRHWLEPSETDL